MPQTGLCTDLTCDKEVTQLYECHCCSSLICLTHLLEHVEVKKKENEKRLDSFTNELITVKTTLELIVEKKLLVIEQEKKLIQQAVKLLNVQTYSVDEIQNMLEQINQAITSNSIEHILKVEPSPLDMNASVFIDKCDVNEKNSHNDQSSRKSFHSESSGMDLANDSDEVEQSTMSDNSMCIDHGQTLLDRTTASKKDERKKNFEIKSLIGFCPLTFDGAYGLTKAKHSIHICSDENRGPWRLYSHFIHKHKLKLFYARRLVQAVANDQDPMTTKIFHDITDITKHSQQIPCPFRNLIFDLSPDTEEGISTTPCGVQSIPIDRLKFHFQHVHHISAVLVDRFVNRFTRTPI